MLHKLAHWLGVNKVMLVSKAEGVYARCYKCGKEEFLETHAMKRISHDTWSQY